MLIKELTIKNFRGISDLKLAFNPDINTIVLIGINGVGKTSILDCLSILLSKFIFDISTSIQIEKNLLSMGEYPHKDHTIKTLNFTDSDQKDHNQQTQAKIKFDWENYQDIILSIPFSNVDNQMPLVGEIQQKLRAKEKTNIPLAIYYNVNRNQLDIS
ncbi:MAG TPA: AAA family ATPase, partial [Allocoleopsis sp.]